jgi:hypothetical protein
MNWFNLDFVRKPKFPRFLREYLSRSARSLSPSPARSLSLSLSLSVSRSLSPSLWGVSPCPTSNCMTARSLLPHNRKTDYCAGSVKWISDDGVLILDSHTPNESLARELSLSVPPRAPRAPHHISLAIAIALCHSLSRMLVLALLPDRSLSDSLTIGLYMIPSTSRFSSLLLEAKSLLA